MVAKPNGQTANSITVTDPGTLVNGKVRWWRLAPHCRAVGLDTLGTACPSCPPPPTPYSLKPLLACCDRCPCRWPLPNGCTCSFSSSGPCSAHPPTLPPILPPLPPFQIRLYIGDTYQPNTRYVFTAFAENAVGWSVASAPLSWTTPDTPVSAEGPWFVLRTVCA